MTIVPLALAVAALLAACSSGSSGGSTSDTYDPRWGVSSSPRVVDGNVPVPKGGGVYKVGNPYQVGGLWYFPRHEPGYDQTGVASWYGPGFHGRRTSNGEVFDMYALTAAHKTLPMPSYAYVTNLESGRTILVRINDRGPYVNDRLIDLSKASAEALGYGGQGLVRVRVRYAGAAPLDGNDGRESRFLASQPWHTFGGRIATSSTAPRYPEGPAPPSHDVYAGQQPGGGWSPFTHRAGLSTAR
jgi:rare lipoprotein A